MPENPIVLSPDVQRLVDEDYEVTIDGQYLIIDSVPYVPAAGMVARGTLISQYTEVDGVGKVNGIHTVWFTGSIPCQADGTSLESALVCDSSQQTVAGRIVLCQLSNKPDPIGDMLDNYYNKMTHYIRKLTSYARAIDETVSASGKGSFSYRQKPSVFLYPNAAISRSGLDEYERKLEVGKAAIIGGGGTGAYILDALAKTPVAEIHVYDDDVIESQNAFRMPGALTIDQAHSNLLKTDHLCQTYSAMRIGVYGHSFRIDSSNLSLLDDCDFVFIAIDDGQSRGLIANYLVDKSIPFIDVGIGVDKLADSIQLHGRMRTTLIDSNTAHLVETLPIADDKDEAVYNNIQLVELNAMNAMFAIIRYKQYFGFYSDEVKAHALKYKISWSQTVLEACHVNEG